MHFSCASHRRTTEKTLSVRNSYERKKMHTTVFRPMKYQDFMTIVITRCRWINKFIFRLFVLFSRAMLSYQRCCFTRFIFKEISRKYWTHVNLILYAYQCLWVTNIQQFHILVWKLLTPSSRVVAIFTILSCHTNINCYHYTWNIS